MDATCYRLVARSLSHCWVISVISFVLFGNSLCSLYDWTKLIFLFTLLHNGSLPINAESNIPVSTSNIHTTTSQPIDTRVCADSGNAEEASGPQPESTDDDTTGMTPADSRDTQKRWFWDRWSITEQNKPRISTTTSSFWEMSFAYIRISHWN